MSDLVILCPKCDRTFHPFRDGEGKVSIAPGDTVRLICPCGWALDLLVRDPASFSQRAASAARQIRYNPVRNWLYRHTRGRP